MAPAAVEGSQQQQLHHQAQLHPLQSATDDHPLGLPDDAQQGGAHLAAPRDTTRQRPPSATQRTNYFDLKDLTQKLERAHTDAHQAAAVAQERAEAPRAPSRAARSRTGDGDISDESSSAGDSEEEETDLFGESSKTPHSVLSPRAMSPRPSSRASKQPQLIVSGSYSSAATPRRRGSRSSRSIRDGTLSPAVMEFANDSSFSQGTVVQHPSWSDDEDEGDESPRARELDISLLANLHLMSDERMDRYVGSGKSVASSVRASSAVQELHNGRASLSPSPLGRMSETKARSERGDSGDSRGYSPSASIADDGRLKIVRATSAALSQALEEASVVKAEMRNLVAEYESQLEMQKRHFEDREEALRELCKQHGISDGAITRCLTRVGATEATAPAKAAKQTEKANDKHYQAALAVPGSHAKESTEDRNLSHSLQEAMTDVFSNETSEPLSRAKMMLTSSLPSPALSDSTTRSGASATAGRSLKSSQYQGSSSSSSSLPAPTGSADPSTPKPASHSSPRSRSKSMSGSALTDLGSASNQSAGLSGWLMPWSKSSSSKAAAVVSTTPEAVVAEEYTSAGPRARSRSPMNEATTLAAPETPTSASTRRHARAASTSAALTAAGPKASGGSGLGLLGTLAWRRKKPIPSLSDDPVFDSLPVEAAVPPSPRSIATQRSDGSRRSGALLASDTASLASRSSAKADSDGGRVSLTSSADFNGDVIKEPEVHPRSTSASITSALDEVLRSPLMSPASERLQAHLGTSGTSVDAAKPVPSHFRAIFLATRIMTADPASIVYDSGSRTSSAIANLALSLVGRAREEGKDIAETPKMADRKTSGKAPSASATKVVEPSVVKATKPKVPGAALTLGRAFGRYTSSSSLGSTQVAEPNVTRLPNIYNYSSPSRGAAPVKVSLREAAPPKEYGSDASTTPLPSVELEAITPAESKPPTLALFTHRRSGPSLPNNNRFVRPGDAQQSLEPLDEESSGDEFEVYGGKGLVRSAPAPVNERDQDASELLTDRYGFVYDATPADVRLLKQARKAATPAPACLTGIRVGVKAKGADSDGPSDLDDGVDDDTDLDAGLDDDTPGVGPPRGDSLVASDSAFESASADTASLRSNAGSSRKDDDPARRLLVPAPSKAVAAASSVSVPSQTSVASGPTSPSQEKTFFFGAVDDARDATLKATKPVPNTSQTVRSLLGQLQTMHDAQQAEQQAEWDVFIRRRREKPARSAADGGASGVSVATTGRKAPAHTLSASGLSGMGGTVDVTAHPEEDWGRGLVGINTMGDTKTGKEDWKEFLRLCQSGVPLCYRAKIWVECSGANEVAEPGRYLELLKEHEGEVNQCTTQIDLDVHRTMPTNVYFGGDGPGVPKLRRVLVAYSWYNPECGYCQGMNNLAATLLLTHEREEEAFWVLVCMIEKILPSEYYTAHLLVSQADQRVLIDLVAELMPELSGHIEHLGVDLPAVTFAWFLSLYTDCLPVETLFRVWDVLFVEGMVTLFRVALAMLTLNERELLATTSPAAFYGHVHSMTSRFFAVDRLIRLACGEMKRDVRYSDILGRREKHVRDLERELGLVGGVDDGPAG